MTTRPDWWETWIPERDANGHELKPGEVSLHRCDCTDAVHHVVLCRVNGCRAPAAKPDGCAGMEGRS